MKNINNNEAQTYKIVSLNEEKIKKQKEFILFKKMLNKQEELNNLTYPKWKEELTLFDWQSAVLVEAGELLESFGYKWWKKQNKDMENVKVELIDILHFLLSNLSYYPKESEFYIFNGFYNEGFLDDNFDIENDLDFKKNVLYLVSEISEIKEQFFYLAKLFKYTGMDFNEVYRAYFVKNILNEFRQKNGYKQGTYIKMWKIDLGEGEKIVEDNVVAYYYAKSIALETLDKELPKKLDEVYEKIKNKI